MLLPLGDEVETRRLPMMGTILIAVNILLGVHTGTLAWQAEEALRAQHFGDGEVLGTDLMGNPLFATRHDFINKLMRGKRWERFVHEWGLVPSTVAEGDMHGVMSYMFLHANLWHLLGNMVVLWIFVRALEAGLGPALTLLLYVFWGIMAGLLQVLIGSASTVPFLGADGAIAGVIGAYICCFGFLARVRVLFYVGFGVQPQVLRIPASFFLSLWILLQVWTWAAAGKWGAANLGVLAHLGGFAIGMLTIAVFKTEVQRKLGLLAAAPVAQGAITMPSFAPPLADAHSPETMAVVKVSTPSSVSLPPPLPCSQCGEPLNPDNRVFDDLYRCPKCAMLTDASHPVRRRSRRLKPSTPR